MTKFIVNFEVKDWHHWKKSFDAHNEPRSNAGIKVVYAGHELENEKKVHVIMDAESPETLKKFMEENKDEINNSGHIQETTSVAVCTD
ncbi:DUF3764 family protein [Pelagibacterales bacterium SAG-MED33]|nr:DUF3764 family protein [Pelagibacterales bacterium SAG-MED33]